RTGGIGLADTAVTLSTDQAADFEGSIHLTGGIGLADTAATLTADQAADTALPGNIDIFQPDMSQSGVMGVAKQPDVIRAATVNKQIADHMAQAIEGAGEAVAVVSEWVPALAVIGGVAGVVVVTCGAAAQVIDQIEVVAAAQYISVVIDVLQLVPVGDGPGVEVGAPAA